MSDLKVRPPKRTNASIWLVATARGREAERRSGCLDLPEGALGADGTLVMLLGVPHWSIFLEEGEQLLEGAGDEVKVLF